MNQEEYENQNPIKIKSLERNLLEDKVSSLVNDILNEEGIIGKGRLTKLLNENSFTNNYLINRVITTNYVTVSWEESIERYTNKQECNSLREKVRKPYGVKLREHFVHKKGFSLESLFSYLESRFKN